MFKQRWKEKVKIAKNLKGVDMKSRFRKIGGKLSA